jgi:ectoine hydroxylase-related dioxygenase (phytanoyl-CoA dioxygenase family)
VPLDDTDIDNGCLWFIPGSHRGDVLEHKHLGDDPSVHILEVIDEIDTSTAVPVPLRAGGVSFHHPRTLHHARANTTDRKRRAWATEYQTAPVELATPVDRPWVSAGQQALVDTFTAQHS